MLVRLNSGETAFFDFREKAPIRACRDMYLDGDGEVIEGLSVSGHKSSGVPGSVAGLFKAHKKYGAISWRKNLHPAVSLAREGVTVSRHLAGSLKKLQSYLERFPGLLKYTKPDGTPLEEGNVLLQPDLAAALQRIADRGADGFYGGETADLIVAEMKRGGGLISIKDLEEYEAVEREPVRGNYRDFEIISAPPPSSGGTTLIEILNIIEGAPVGDYGILSEDFVHWMVEAEKRAYADRARFLGDPDFIDIPATTLLSKRYAKHLRSNIGRFASEARSLDGGGLQGYESEETTHYSILDSSGNAVAVTTTLNGSYGSKVVVGGAGFLLNNEMDDFSIKPGFPNMYGLTGGSANSIEPQKRMLSSMAPTIVLKNGEVFLILGTPGGSTIITTVAQIIVDIIDFNMSPEDAVSLPRFHNQWLPDRIDYERGAFSTDLIKGLAGRGHEFKERTGPMGNAQVIQVIDSFPCGISDPREGGKAVGTRDDATEKHRRENLHD